MSHLMRTDRDGVHELGLLVEDAWQNRGLGMSLACHAVHLARRLDCHSVAVMTDAANTPMLAITRRLGAFVPPSSSGVVDLVIPVAGAGRCPQG
ncbi:hypothetical protein C6Y14_12300 [Streptomyces dioscori]|uniref:N-acetyltransferase domain-containing protein n=1 Tax=Streptomyces dioscori TaxID=2109333 RepID=A0A2P8Q9Q8_9ACTN|nr:GNAT family N-acetyltransferase [Streptomyces dioscori]PSM42958.1 hypothetical protein C6Y14_12300 [Streptomyces dioscori]